MKAIKMVPIADINVSEIAIRGTNIKDEKFLGLKEDIKQRFARKEPDYVQQAITVRQVENPADPKSTILVLVDGLQRFTACKELGIKVIPAIDKGKISNMDALRSQFSMNYHRVAQKPAQEGQQFQRMLVEDPSLTVSQLSALVGCNNNYKLLDRIHQIILQLKVNSQCQCSD